LRWDDKITDNLSYWFGGNFSNNKKRIKSLKDATPINGGDLANGQFTKLLDNSSIGKPLGSFYLYDYAGFDPENGKMLYYTAAGTVVKTHWMLIKIKIFRFYLAFHIRNYFRVNYKNFDFSVDGYGTSGAKVYNGKKAQRFQEKI
jgi:hypothetical protein